MHIVYKPMSDAHVFTENIRSCSEHHYHCIKKSTAPTFISMRRVPTQRAPQRKSTVCLLGADCIYCKILKSATWKMKTKTKKFKLMNNFIIKLSFLYPASSYYTVNVMGKKTSHWIAHANCFCSIDMIFANGPYSMPVWNEISVTIFLSDCHGLYEQLGVACSSTHLRW